MDGKSDLLRKAVVNWKKVCFYALPIAVVSGLFVAKLGAKKGRAEEDYVSAMGIFNKWEQAIDQGGDDFAKLEKLVKKHPELQAEYDAAIAQRFLALVSPQKATPFIERTLERTRQPYYSDFARTSLKISEEKYQEALDEALVLKDRIEPELSFSQQSSPFSTLFAFNLMRIAALSKRLNLQELELEAWKEVREYGGWSAEKNSGKTPKNKGFGKLLNHFSIHETTLLDYISARERELKNA